MFDGKWKAAREWLGIAIGAPPDWSSPTAAVVEWDVRILAAKIQDRLSGTATVQWDSRKGHTTDSYGQQSDAHVRTATREGGKMRAAKCSVVGRATISEPSNTEHSKHDAASDLSEAISTAENCGSLARDEYMPMF